MLPHILLFKPILLTNDFDRTTASFALSCLSFLNSELTLFQVLHPGIYRHVERDLRVLRVLGRILEFCVPGLKWMSISECLDEFSNLMTRQVNVTVDMVKNHLFYSGDDGHNMYVS